MMHERWIAALLSLMIVPVYFAVLLILNWIQFDESRLPKRVERIIKKQGRSGIALIQVSDRLGRLYDSPAERAAMLTLAPEISRLLIEGEVAETHGVISSPETELDPRLRTELRLKVKSVEDQIYDLITETVAAHKRAEIAVDQSKQLAAEKEAEALKQVVQIESQARLAGNNMHAKLLLREGV